MSHAESFEDLVIWKKAHHLVLEVYRVTEALPRAEEYGLKRQMRRSAVSVPANIAEGFTRRTTADKARFLNIAQGSFAELSNYFILVKDLDFLSRGVLDLELKEVHQLVKDAESTMYWKARRERG